MSEERLKALNRGSAVALRRAPAKVASTTAPTTPTSRTSTTTLRHRCRISPDASIQTAPTIAVWRTPPREPMGSAGEGEGCQYHPGWDAGHLGPRAAMWLNGVVEPDRITVFLADDNVIVREGVRALLAREPDLEIVGTADDYEELLAGAEAADPQVLVTDIRMPPAFQREGIDAAKELRKRHPGTGVVVLSQYDDPEYAIALLADGAAGYAYLLKDRVAEGDQLARAVREVATGGSVLDPKIVEALVHPVVGDGGLSADEEVLLQQVAEGKPIKAIAAAQHTTPAAVAEAVEKLFIALSREANSGAAGSLRRLRLMHQAIVDREEQGETLSRLLPTGLAEKVRIEGKRIGETEELVVTVVMSDVRGYSGIAERADPSAARPPAQRAPRRDERRDPLRGRNRHAVRR